ncbi:isoprenoid synthase domain-containing protein [Triangularia setosa]|uniref:Isoprenoid synthase domain-containing protein n=1 Tax=Triangularia setosa TaxID=2587417 RepID=A0AAN7A9T5_9PEZI|nr:isoprenoid synthase domain-containing protein [Podospora setosa]
MTELTGQTLFIPPLRCFLRTCKTSSTHPHPHHQRLKEEVVDPVLESLVPHPKALERAKESDTALLVCGLFPSLTRPEDFEKMETVAIWVVWIVFWDDAIDSASSGLVNAGEYVELSKQYVKYCLFDGLKDEVEAPTKVCELMKTVGERLRDVNGWSEGQRERLWERLRKYMDSCLEEYNVRISGNKVAELRVSGREVTEHEFWMWRTGTSGVEAFCLMGRVMNGGGGGLPGGLLEWEEVRRMEGMVNKGFVKDGAFMNLIPIAMHDRNCNLEDAVRGLMDDFGYYGCEFQAQASLLRARAEKEYGGEIVGMVEKTIEAYEAIVTGILDFSVQSPRYGMKQYEREDGYFEIPL